MGRAVGAISVQAWRSVPQKERVAPATRAVEPAEAFAEVVRGAIDGPVLRYSERLRLLKAGERLGVGRFEANLVIAQELHRHGIPQEYELPPAERRGRWWSALATVGVVQGVIFAGAWWALG